MGSLVKTLLCMAAVVASCCVTVVRASVASGRPAPDFTFTDLSGKAHKLSDYRGKVVILEWVSPVCPFVLRHYRSGNMPATQATAAKEGAVWLQINSSATGDLDAASTAEWQKKNGVLASAYIRDQSGKLGRLYNAKTTPHLYVIGKDSTLVYQGAIDDQPNARLEATASAHNYGKAALAALKSGQPVEKATTQAYGCAIKYGSKG